MEWKKLLSQERLAKEERDEEYEKYSARYPISSLSPFEEDYERIVSSPAFRRLQDKTQVFPLSKSDFVRTRLTHSLEVSTIAKQLGIMCFQNKSSKPLFPLDEDDDQDQNIES